ncbi:MAG: hypothetical protein SXA11_08190 [Cyanobacteriota bacterium]|nr:hypothetical protein [Cyanobacteriota bacterium]
MNKGIENESGQSLSNWPDAAEAIRALAREHKGNPTELLALLRSLESLHQELREGLFQESLPNNRQRLYNLIKEIEANGGWPYIPRMKLRSLFKHFQAED